MPKRHHRWQAGVALFLIALGVRIWFIAFLHTYTDLDRYELERTALSLAFTGVYGNPYAVPTGPTAHVSPGYTLILAAIFHLFGTDQSAEMIKNLFAALVTSLQCCLVPAVAVALGLSRRVGILAALFLALLPLKPLVQLEGDWEAPYTALFLMATTVLVTKLWTKQDCSVRNALLHGFTWGFGILFASVLLPVLAATTLAGLWFTRTAGWRRYLSFCAIELAVVFLCLSPWMIRNQRALGSPLATRSNVGIELRVSNNDQATPDQRVNSQLGVYNLYHPLQNAGEALKVKQLGEVAFSKLDTAAAYAWIRSHPQRFLALTFGRIRCFWLYPEVSLAKAIIDDSMALLAFAALVLLAPKRPIVVAVILIEVLLYSAPSYLVQVGTRQRYPIDWLLTLLATYTVIFAADRLFRKQASLN